MAALESSFEFRYYTEIDIDPVPTLRVIEITEFTETQISFQLEFNHVNGVSADSLEPDRLTCKVDPYVFRDAFTGEPVGASGQLEINLPRLMDKDFARKL